MLVAVVIVGCGVSVLSVPDVVGFVVDSLEVPVLSVEAGAADDETMAVV